MRQRDLVMIVLLLAGLPTGSAALGETVPVGKSEPERSSLAERYRNDSERIISAALGSNDAYRKLAELCDDIGHRLSGSPQLERALDWAAETLRRDGHENVRIEHVMVPRWVRGAESLTMTLPRTQSLPMLGLGGSVGTGPEGITAPVLSVPDEAALEALGDGAKGKIILFDNPMPTYDPATGSGYGTTVRFRGKGARLAAEQGAVACLVRSVTATSLRSPHTGAMRYGDARVKIPAAAISTEDAAMITRLGKRDVPVEATLRMEARDEEMAPSGNVIAELRGATAPQEIIVISGHIDSWDVGQGAHDDGAGCVIAMEALKVLRKLKMRPRRTIRVVLWTNEENGLAGAKQYAVDHKAELSMHVAAIEADSGGFQPIGYSIECKDKEMEELAAAQMRDILRLLEPLGATNVTVGHSGADLSPMKETNVVLMGHRCEGTKYFDYHHSRADTLDKVDPDELARNVAVMATVAFVLADMPERIGTRRGD